MRNFSNRAGSLLLEVLIASAVLAIGILACLRVFSGSLHFSERITNDQTVVKAMDNTFFEWFLNPSDFDDSLVNSGKKTNSLFKKEVQAVSLNALKTPDGKQKPVSAISSNAMAIEFYEVSFSAQAAKKQPEYNNQVYLFRYGPKKIELPKTS